MSEFRMPSLGTDMEAGILVEWLKKPGEPIRRGDTVAVVETQKGAIEVEIFTNGVMGQPLVALGAKVPVGTPLAVILDEAASGGVGISGVTPPVFRPAEPGTQLPQQLLPSTGFRASPAARKAAQARGVDLSRIRGTGPEGAVTLHDVEAAASGLPEVRVGMDLEKMRAAIGTAMAHSKRDIPHYYLSNEIDMSRAEAWLEKINAGRPPENRLLPALIVLKAVALAARKYPKFNGMYDPVTGFKPSDRVHIGAAISIRGGGLIAPAIHDCDVKDLDSLMLVFRDLIARTRTGRLRSSEISESTITVSNLGDRGVDSLFGVIYPPQVAILGFGKVRNRPVAVSSDVRVHPVVMATLAADHRVSDGHLGSLFLMEIASLLNEPERL